MIVGFEILIVVALAEMPLDLHVLASIVLAFHRFGILANCLRQLLPVPPGPVLFLFCIESFHERGAHLENSSNLALSLQPIKR